jgi:hypothetical protein
MGVGMAFVGGTAALLIDSGPERRGLAPDGGVALDNRNPGIGPIEGASIREAITSHPFWLLYLASDQGPCGR